MRYIGGIISGIFLTLFFVGYIQIHNYESNKNKVETMHPCEVK